MLRVAYLPSKSVRDVPKKPAQNTFESAAASNFGQAQSSSIFGIAPTTIGTLNFSNSSGTTSVFDISTRNAPKPFPNLNFHK